MQNKHPRLSQGSHWCDAGNRMWFKQEPHPIPVQIIYNSLQCDLSSFILYGSPHVFTPRRSNSYNRTAFYKPFCCVVHLTLTPTADYVNAVQLVDPLPRSVISRVSRTQRSQSTLATRKVHVRPPRILSLRSSHLWALARAPSGWNDLYWSVSILSHSAFSSPCKTH